MTIYSTGTVSVTNGDAVVTGSGTAWAVALISGGMFSSAGVAVPIASVESDTSLTLAYPWPGTTAAGAAYAIARENSEAADIVDLNDKLSRVLVTLSLAGITPDASGTLTERDALTLAVGDKGFLFLHAELGYDFEFYRWSGSAWVGPFAVRGDDGAPGVIGVWHGPWLTATAYFVNDAVSQGGSSYICVTAHTSGTFATDLAAGKWQLVAQKGDTGLGVPAVAAGDAKKVLQVKSDESGYELIPFVRAVTPSGLVLNDSSSAVASANRAAIQAALDAAGPGDAVLLPSGGTIFIKDAGLKVFNGQYLGGLAPSGDIFSASPVAGTTIAWAGASGQDYLVAFGADPSAVSPVQTFGGGIGNIQLDGASIVKKVLRLAACGRAKFHNIKAMRPLDTGLVSDGNAAIWMGANATVAGLENTIRHCDFDNVFAFASGTGHCFHNQSNGTEGGLTFCTGRDLRADFGYASGAGRGFYFSSMDDCVFNGLTARRNSGGTGQGLYLNGNGVSGIVCVGNVFSMVKMSGGCPVLADGQYSSENLILGLSGVDEAATVVEQNNGRIDVVYLGTGYGATPGSVSQQPTTVRAKNATNNGVSRLLTLSHDLNAAASSPAVGIGVEQAFEALTAAGVKKILSSIRSSATNVTTGSEAGDFAIKLLIANVLTEVLTVTPTLVNQVGVNPAFRSESTGVGGAASAGMRMKTGNHSNEWQFVTKAGGFVIGVQSVADYTTWDTTGNITNAGYIKSSHATGGIGYGTGAGGAVTQGTSKATGVTLNKAAGQITMNAAALASAAKVSFIVTNSAVAATDTVVVSVASGGTANAYRAAVTAVAAGSFTVTVENITAGSLSEAPVINFAVLKAVAA